MACWTLGSIGNSGDPETSFKVHILAHHEARVGQRGTLTRIWAEKGTRPRVVRQQQFTAAYVFGAVCPDKDCAYALLMPDANTEAMQHHLDGQCH